jgi:hypothetical protein
MSTQRSERHGTICAEFADQFPIVLIELLLHVQSTGIGKPVRRACRVRSVEAMYVCAFFDQPLSGSFSGLLDGHGCLDVLDHSG